jgi:hypothetical protein
VGAIAYVALPAWSALIEHVPVATSVTEVPETVQTLGVDEVKVTARSEEAVADIEIGLAVNEFADKAPKVIVWARALTLSPVEPLNEEEYEELPE